MWDNSHGAGTFWIGFYPHRVRLGGAVTHSSCALGQMQYHADAVPSSSGTQLLDLDDSLIRHICHMLQPLPDLFNMGQTCWRMSRLTHDKQRWLVVAPPGHDLRNTPAVHTGRTYPTLAAAVSASRPGDTLWLAPHLHHAASGVAVSWPLQLLGGGQRPEDTWLLADKGADCALEFSATAKLARVAVAATLAPCLIHRSGTLTVDQCLLTSDAQGLSHLVSPLLTCATQQPQAVAAAATQQHRGSATSQQPLAAAAVAPLPGRQHHQEEGQQQQRQRQKGTQHEQRQQAGTPHEQQLAPASLRPPGQQQQQQHTGDNSNTTTTTPNHIQAAALSSSAALTTTPSHAQAATLGSSSAPTTTRSNNQAAAQKLLLSKCSTCMSAATAAAIRARPAAGPGRLSVLETQLRGGAAGVQCAGTGRLRGVRVIYEAHAAFFWLEVDSADPGRVLLVPGVKRSWHAAAEGGDAVVPAQTKRQLASCGQQQQQQGDGEGQQQQLEAGEVEGRRLSGLLRIQALLGPQARLLQEQLTART